MTNNFHLIIYGATPAGIGAALAAAREGLRVVIMEPSGRIGGMVTGGLSRTDLGRPETVGGIFREFMNRVVQHYQRYYGEDSIRVQDCLGGQRFEPKVAHIVLSEMLEEAGVEVRIKRTLTKVKVDAERLAEVEFEGPDGNEKLTASVFVDASYEGDLLAATGAEYRVGREARSEYEEDYAGHLFWDPSSGRPTSEGTGEGDDRVQAYCFRLCLTDDPERRVPIEKPEGFNRDCYELLMKYLAAAPRQLKDVLLLGKLPNRKWDVNNWGFCWQSMDYIEGNAGYVETNWERRAEIAREHREYQRGLLYFLQNDPAVPSELRREVGQFGFCADEFDEFGGWPEQLYMREARRLVGEYIFTEHDARRDRTKTDAIAVGSYPLDSHATQWYRIGQSTPAPEGFFMCSVRPYEIPYRALLPRSPKGLLAPVCLSATHAGYGTLRMEPVMMNLGMACGTAAELAIETDVGPEAIEVAELQRRLKAKGQVISVDQRR